MSTPSRITSLLEALQAEKAHEQSTFKEFLAKASLQERRAQGVCWYPLKIKETGFGLGDYPFIVVERTQDLDTPHMLSAGKPALFFSQHLENPLEQGIKGTIHFAGHQVLKIILQADDFPEWIDEGKLGIQLLFDDKSFVEMEQALAKVEDSKNPALQQLANIVAGNSSPRFETVEPVSIPQLNPSQQKAVEHILSAKDIAIVHGPPGTGKTTTLVEAIHLLSKKEGKVLVTAPSNAAADLLTEKLAQKGLRVVRIGHLSRIDENVLPFSLEQQIINHPDFKNIKTFKKQADEYRRMANKYKREFGRAEREQRNLLLAEAKKIIKEAQAIEDHITEKVLTDADAVCCTLVGSQHYTLKNIAFKTAVIDEAGQATEPATWIPITRAEKVVLAGDPFQLPPTVKGTAALKAGLGTSLLEVAIKHQVPSVLLDTQYRMHATIMGFSNDWFYASKLQAHPSAIDHRIDEFPLEFIDTAGCSFEEVLHPASVSFYNPGEAKVLAQHYQHLSQSHTQPMDIGIISPYREQVVYLEKNIPPSPHQTEVQTIDSFQGNEKDVIYISLVRSNEKGDIGFLSDYRRMNVAMTRARKKLVIIGDSATIGMDSFYKKFLEYAEAHGQYTSAWEWMDW